MAVSISYYPRCAGTDCAPTGKKGLCCHYFPELEKITELVSDLPMVLAVYHTKPELSSVSFKDKNGFFSIHKKPYHLSLEANSAKELSDLALDLSMKIADLGFPYYSLPYDHSKVEEIN
ncbi:Uncharacterised protein [uncultured archaeon]|nr:Uncharacterised protein [uncultured archaeon]